MARVIVCGGRNLDAAMVARWLLAHLGAVLVSNGLGGDLTIISGMAPGADSGAVRYAATVGCGLAPYPADWARYGLGAGFRRNQRMLDEGLPDLVVAFPGGRGTADMVRRALKAGVPVFRVERRGPVAGR